MAERNGSRFVLMPDLDDLQQMLRRFANERAWEQFHTPKNLAMALTGEVGELVELFQWLDAGESTAIMMMPDRAARVREELADVFAYLLRLADVLEVDLVAALVAKIAVNAEKYPVESSHGSAAKY